MTKLQRRFVTALATGALLANTVLPAFAGTTIEISGNGADSKNKAEVDIDQSTYVEQSNQADIDNHVYAKADSGDNDANRNTGGGVSVDTGDASTTVSVSNQANSNVADVDCCGTGDVDVLISGNGDSSRNRVNLDVNDDPETGTLVVQKNSADIDNDVKAKAETGDNDANRNTGGDVSIMTGMATTGVTVSNSANCNMAYVGGSGEGGMSLSAKILGNGADTRNKIDLDFDRSVWVEQTNRADIDNDVEAKAESGDNDANRNTGGTVSISTGDATAGATVDNAINFNWADVDCGCMLDVLAKVADNGADSKNKIEAYIDDVLGIEQENKCGTGYYWPNFGCFGMMGCKWWKPYQKPCLDNEVMAKADTGDNDVRSNTGNPGVDPSIDTGNADTEVIIENRGNSNVFGEIPELEMPEMPDMTGGFSINISLDLSALLAMLGLA